MRVVTDFSVVSARRVRPSGPALSLDFAAGSFLAKGKPKTLAEVISFTRAGSALRRGGWFLGARRAAGEIVAPAARR